MDMVVLKIVSVIVLLFIATIGQSNAAGG